jgi:hypothetical protein
MNNTATATRKSTTSARGKITQTIEIAVDGEIVLTLKGKSEVRKSWVAAYLLTGYYSHEGNADVPEWFATSSIRRDLSVANRDRFAGPGMYDGKIGSQGIPCVMHQSFILEVEGDEVA